MNRMKKFIIPLLLAVAMGVALFGRASANVDSWSGHNEQMIPFSQSVTLNTTALVVTGVASTRINVRAITITDSASGVVKLYSGSDNSLGSNLIAAYGVIANTPLVLNEDQMGQGVKTALTKGLYVDAATGTVSLTVRVRLDPN